MVFLGELPLNLYYTFLVVDGPTAALLLTVFASIASTYHEGKPLNKFLQFCLHY